jgi:hypothetical protein
VGRDLPSQSQCRDACTPGLGHTAAVFNVRHYDFDGTRLDELIETLLAVATLTASDCHADNTGDLNQNVHVVSGLHRLFKPTYAGLG